jgi:acyl-CoA hydrolase
MIMLVLDRDFKPPACTLGVGMTLDWPSMAHRHAAETLLKGRSHATVLAAMSPQLPHDLVVSLIQVARQRGVSMTLMVADLTGRWEFVDEAAMQDVAAGRLRLVAVAGGVPRRLGALVDYVPNSLWDVDRLLGTGELAIDVFVARVGQGVDEGTLSYGNMIGFSASALATKASVGFEVAQQTVQHAGAGGIPLDRAEVVVAAVRGLMTSSTPTSATPAQRSIARRVAALVPDGATIQVGLGAVPLAVIGELTGKQHLGVHSGILPAQLQSLIASGVLTGARKTRDALRHVATGVMGGDPHGWGSQVLLRPVSQTHDPSILLTLESLWAINSAFEVDLAGQVNAEFVAGSRVASGGGQTDFVRAAHGSRYGASVLALPARSRAGSPRIVGHLPAAHTATTSGSDVDFLVTEHGVARLRGGTAGERAASLIEVAHPDDRKQLRADWRVLRGA